MQAKKIAKSPKFMLDRMLRTVPCRKRCRCTSKTEKMVYNIGILGKLRGQICSRTAWLPPRSRANEIGTATLLKRGVDPRDDAWRKRIHLDGRSDPDARRFPGTNEPRATSEIILRLEGAPKKPERWAEKRFGGGCWLRIPSSSSLGTGRGIASGERGDFLISVPPSTISYRGWSTSQENENPARPCTCAGRFRRQVGADQRSAQEHGLPVRE